MVEHECGMLVEHPRAGLQRRPRDRHAHTADAPPEQDAHPDRVAALELHALEGQPDLHRVPAVVAATGALPDPVRRDVFFRRRAVQHVELNPARVDHHVVRHLAGAERIQAQAHPVVAEDVVAACDGCLDLGRFRVVALEREVEIPRVVADPHVRGLRDACRRAGDCRTATDRQRPPASPTPRRRAHRRWRGAWRASRR